MLWVREFRRLFQSHGGGFRRLEGGGGGEIKRWHLWKGGGTVSGHLRRSVEEKNLEMKQ